MEVTRTRTSAKRHKHRFDNNTIVNDTLVTGGKK